MRSDRQGDATIDFVATVAGIVFVGLATLACRDRGKGEATSSEASAEASPPPSPKASLPAAPSGRAKFAPLTVVGSHTVIDATPADGSLDVVIRQALVRAGGKPAKLIALVYAPSCVACDDVVSTLAAWDMQNMAAPGGDYPFAGVTILRLDAVAWKSELSGHGMAREGEPWFFRFDGAGKVAGAVRDDDLPDDSGKAAALADFLKGATPEPK
jgi:hypothetical protein